MTAMLYHVSIPADAPERVAQTIGEICAGVVLPFAPVPGAYMVWLGDERRTIIEVNPRGGEHVPATGQFGIRSNPTPSAYSECHLAIGTALSADEVLAIGGREGWLTQRSDRGDRFAVVEVWLENKFLVEVLTDAEQQRYVRNLSIDFFRALAALNPPRGLAP
jgi:hypothetical protein